MDYLVWMPNRSFCFKKLLLKSPVVHGTQRCHRTYGLHCAKNAFSIMHRDNTSHHKIPAGRLQSGNLVSWTGDSHGDRVHHKPKVSGPLFGDEVTLLPVQAPTQNDEQQSSNLSMEIQLGRRRSLDENVIHVNGYQDPPSHSQESHNRLKDLRKHSRAISEPKGKQET